MTHTQIIEHFGMFGNKSVHQASPMFYVITSSIFNINILKRNVYETK